MKGFRHKRLKGANKTEMVLREDERTFSNFNTRHSHTNTHRGEIYIDIEIEKREKRERSIPYAFVSPVFAGRWIQPHLMPFVESNIQHGLVHNLVVNVSRLVW